MLQCLQSSAGKLFVFPGHDFHCDFLWFENFLTQFNQTVTLNMVNNQDYIIYLLMLLCKG